MEATEYGHLKMEALYYSIFSRQ